MEDRVADVLAERATMENGSAVAIAVSLVAHAGLSALAVWGAWHSTSMQAPTVMNIRFAQPAQVSAAPPPAAPAAEVRGAPPKPAVAPPKPIAKPVEASPFGRSTKKATEVPPAPIPAPAATSTQPDIAIGGSGVTALEGGDFPYTIYIDRMKNLIGTHWLRPSVPTGTTTTIRFVINRDGSIRDTEIEIKSGSSEFDRAARRAVLESSPLPPLPFGYSGTYLGVHLTFR